MKHGTRDGRHSPHGLIHGTVTNQILAAAYRVHTDLGPGLLESAYKACLVHELSSSGLACDVEKLLPVSYRGVHMDLGYRLDVVVEHAVVVEIKAVQAPVDSVCSVVVQWLPLDGRSYPASSTNSNPSRPMLRNLL